VASYHDQASSREGELGRLLDLICPLPDPMTSHEGARRYGHEDIEGMGHVERCAERVVVLLRLTAEPAGSPGRKWLAARARRLGAASYARRYRSRKGVAGGRTRPR
jgi:hypothetical protein